MELFYLLLEIWGVPNSFHYITNKAAEVSATCLSLGDNLPILELCAFLEFLFFLENC